MDDNEIEAKLLYKFLRRDIWGKYHIREENMFKGFPSHQRHNVKRIAEELRRHGLLVRFPTNHGMQWYANMEKIDEIKRIVMSSKYTLNE